MGDEEWVVLSRAGAGYLVHCPTLNIRNLLEMVQSIGEDALNIVSFDWVGTIDPVQLLILLLVLLLRAGELREEAPFRVIVASRYQTQFLSLLYRISIFLGWTARFGALNSSQVIFFFLLYCPSLGSSTWKSVSMDRWRRSVVFGFHHGPSIKVTISISTRRVCIFLEGGVPLFDAFHFPWAVND